MQQVVVHYLDSSTFGGVEQVVLMLLRGTDRRRWKPVLYVHENDGIARLLCEARALDVTCRSVPRPENVADVQALLEFRQQLVEDRPAVFHAHLSWTLGCRLGIALAKLAGIRCITATSHLITALDGVRWAAIKQRMQVAAIDRYIAVSHAVSSRLQMDFQVPRRMLRVVHNGIPIPRMAPRIDRGLRATLLHSPNLPIVLTAARLHEHKGHDYLLDAAVQVPGAVFAFAGEGPERDRLEAKATSLGIRNRVRFLGLRDDVGQLLAACDLFVLPSLHEGFPLSVLEAMAAARPVIATSVGGTAEAVLDGETGLLVQPADAAALASAINRLLADPAQAARLANAGRERVTQSFSFEAMVRGVESVYDESLAA